MRFEYKYIVHNRHLDSFREMLLPFVSIDSFAEADGRNEYTVRSVYFDTPSYDFYFEKVEGIKNRKKVRLRGYDQFSPEDTVFLEIKRKYDIPIIKYRAPVKFTNAIQIFKEKSINGYILENFKGIDGYENSKRFFYQVFSKNLRPIVLVVYEREAYFSRFDKTVRITLDKNLRGVGYPSVEDLYTDDSLKKAMENYFILEVKFNRTFPGWLNPLIAKYNLKKRSASKYVITMDSSKVIKKLSKSGLYTRSNWYN